jgi:RNA polymerase sigma-70 factor (ECF subfamily)
MSASLVLAYSADVTGEPTAETIRQAQARLEPMQGEVLCYLYPIIHKQLAYLFGFHRDFEDCVQESMLSVYRALPGFAFRSSLKTWACRVAVWTSRKQLRKAGHSPPADDADAVLTLYEPVNESSRLELIHLTKALARLQTKKRESYILMEIMGLTAKEAGQALGTFANTAASRCRHAKAEMVAMYGSDVATEVA